MKNLLPQFLILGTLSLLGMGCSTTAQLSPPTSALLSDFSRSTPLKEKESLKERGTEREKINNLF